MENGMIKGVGKEGGERGEGGKKERLVTQWVPKGKCAFCLHLYI
jgi:hypothetical protein